MAQLIPNWVRIKDMPDGWKDGRILLWWTDKKRWYRSCWIWADDAIPHGDVVTHVSADTIAGPDEEPQR
jgi:hypothetical protein